MWLASVVSVAIASQIASGPIDDQPKHARRDQPVTLHAVVFIDGVAHSQAQRVVIRGKSHRARPLPAGLRLHWFKVEPAVETLSNTPEGKFRWTQIPYVATEVVPWRDRAQAPADVRPTAITDHGGGLGTMRFQIAVGLPDGRVVRTPGVEARRGGPSGGLGPEVHRISIRRDDTYLGWLTELYGQPYIWASAGTTPRVHQTERLEGSDCADFVTYGWRRLGHDVDYTWTGGLPKVTRSVASGAMREDGVYVDDRGAPIAFPAAGDLILLPRHVGALVEDRGVPGVLDAGDVMVHTCFAQPREQTLRDSGWSGTRVEIRRWSAR